LCTTARIEILAAIMEMVATTGIAIAMTMVFPIAGTGDRITPIATDEAVEKYERRRANG
jgi:hypothetical protein